VLEIIPGYLLHVIDVLLRQFAAYATTSIPDGLLEKHFGEAHVVTDTDLLGGGLHPILLAQNGGLPEFAEWTSNILRQFFVKSMIQQDDVRTPVFSIFSHKNFKKK